MKRVEYLRGEVDHLEEKLFCLDSGLEGSEQEKTLERFIKELTNELRGIENNE